MENFAGALVVLAGVLFAVIGLRGTQHAALPGLFPKAGSSSSGGTAGTLDPNSGQGGADPNNPSLYPGGGITT